MPVTSAPSAPAPIAQVDAQWPPVWQLRVAGLLYIALILLGGLRELTAHTLEDGDDVRGIAETAVSACIGLISAGLSG